MTDPGAADCVFCRIVSGSSASVVYRDDEVMAFMDTRPVNPGHVLVIPTRHYASLADVPERVGARCFVVAQRVASALRASVSVEAVRSVAAQRVHVMGGQGSGKTTLARRLGSLMGAGVYELDLVGWSGTNRRPGWRRLFRFLWYTRRYYWNLYPPTPIPEDGEGNATRWRTAERLTRFPEKVVRCRSGADVEAFVAALPHSRRAR